MFICGTWIYSFDNIVNPDQKASPSDQETLKSSFSFENIVDPDQMASNEAILSGSTLFLTLIEIKS